MSIDENKSCCSVSRDTEKSTLDIRVSKKKSGQDPTKNMVRIKGGSFLMGTEDREGFPQDQEGPITEVKVTDFYIDPYAVTNAEFAEFVADTGYMTEAERFGSSFVFHLLLPEEVKRSSQYVMGTPWWFDVKGAYWKKPEGPDSSIEGREKHPVTHVSWNDAMAYCVWAKKRLPTEIEWEYAARGGLEQKKYVWGDELTPNGEHYCNIWQGDFPRVNTKEDGFIGTAPVDQYKPNGYGLYNMAGNVWEWCQNGFEDKYAEPKDLFGERVHSQTKKTTRGGSFLCHRSYCNRYRVAARTANTVESSTSNMGFRCVISAE